MVDTVRPRSLGDIVANLVQGQDDAGDPNDSALYDAVFLAETVAIADVVSATEHTATYWVQHIATETGTVSRTTGPFSANTAAPFFAGYNGAYVAAGKTLALAAACVPSLTTGSLYTSVLMRTASAGLTAGKRVIDITVDASNWIRAYWDGAANLVFERRGGGTTDTTSIAVTWAANAILSVYVGWDATHLEAAVSTVAAGVITTVASTHLPTGTALVYVGTDNAGANVLDGVFGAVTTFSARLSQAQVSYFFALTRPPRALEDAATMITTWWGSTDKWDSMVGMAVCS